MYITYTDVANYLGVTLTVPQQAQVTALIAQIQSYIEKYCNRKWDVAGTQTELFDGGTNVFFVKYPEISSISSVKVDGDTYTDFHNYKTHVKLEIIATEGWQNVEIKYTQVSGVPEDIKLVMIQWCAGEYLSAQTGGQSPQSVTVGPVTVNYGSGSESHELGDAVPDLYQSILDQYRLEPYEK